MSNFDKSVDFLETNRYLEIMSKEKSSYLQKSTLWHGLPLHKGFDIFHRLRWVCNRSNAKPIKIQYIFILYFFETTRLRLQIDWFWLKETHQGLENL